MPERKNIIRVEASKVQGDGAWVDVRRPTVGERLASLERDVAEGRFVFDINSQEVCSFVVDWNWVDGDGNPLPKPADDPDVYKALTADEIALLLEAVWGVAADRKN